MSDTASPSKNQAPALLALTEVIHATRLSGNASASPVVSAAIAKEILFGLTAAGYEIRAVQQ